MWKSRSFGEKIALIGLIVAIISAIAAVIVVPQVQQLVQVAGRNTTSLPSDARSVLDEALSGRGLGSYRITSEQQASYPQSMTWRFQPADEVWCVTIDPPVQWNDAGVNQPYKNFLIYRQGGLWFLPSGGNGDNASRPDFLQAGCSNWQNEDIWFRDG